MSHELPEGWVSAPLDALVIPQKGKKPDALRCDAAPRFVPYLDIHAIEQREVRQFADADSSRLACESDLLVVWDGARSGWVGTGACGAIGSTIMALTSRGVEPLYLRHFIASQFDTINTNTRGTGIPHVDPELFWKLEVPVAPLGEQRRIVAKLETLLGKVDACQRRLAKIPRLLKRFRQSVLAAACSGRLTADWREERTTEGTDVNEDLPRSWGFVEFGRLISNGPQNGLYKPASFYGDGTLIVRIDAFYDGTIVAWNELKRVRLTEKERSQFALRNGDILVNRVNSANFLGKSALVRKLNEPCVYESNMMRLGLDTSRALPDYAILFLQSLAGLAELRKNAKHAVNQSSINQEDVKAVMFNLPPLAEQDEIVRRVEQLFTFADQIEARFAKARAHVDKLTQSLLAKAFRGELVPQDPGDERACALLARIRSSVNGAEKPARRKVRAIA